MRREIYELKKIQQVLDAKQGKMQLVGSSILTLRNRKIQFKKLICTIDMQVKNSL